MLKLLREIINWFLRFDGVWALVFAPLLVVLTIVYAGFSLLHMLLTWVLDQIDTAVSSAATSVGSHGLDSIATDFWVTVNTFFPLDLVFEYGTVLIGLKLTFAAVRIIKSFIPTIAS